jgi:hypothetical protein
MTLVERLRREDHIPTFTDSVTWALVNPDGPEAADALETALGAGEFLSDRLRDFSHDVDASDTETIYREFHGHVAPALARFDAALEKIRSGR